MAEKTKEEKWAGQTMNSGPAAAYWALLQSKRVKFLFAQLHQLHPNEIPALEELDKTFRKEAQEEFSRRFPDIELEFGE